MTVKEIMLEALKTGIVVKRYPKIGGYNVFYGNDLYIIYYEDKYQLCVRSRSGSFTEDEYGDVWVLRPDDLHDYDKEFDSLYEDLFLENFG